MLPELNQTFGQRCRGLQSRERADQHARESPFAIAQLRRVGRRRSTDNRSVRLESFSVVNMEQSSYSTEECLLLGTSGVGWQPNRATQRAPTSVVRVDVLQFETRFFDVLGKGDVSQRTQLVT